MPGGAIDAIAAGAITGVSRIFAMHCDPRLEVGKVAVRQGPITSAADSIEITLYSPGGHTSRPLDRRPGLRARHADHRSAWRVVAPHRPAQREGPGVGRGQRRSRRQRHPTDRRAVRHGPHREPETGSAWRNRPESVTGLLSPLAIEHTLRYHRGVPPVVNEDISTRILTHAIEAVGPMRWPTPGSPGAARISPGTSRRFRARWPGWRVVGAGCAAGPASADVRSRRAGPGDRRAGDDRHRRAGGRLLTSGPPTASYATPPSLAPS